MEMALLNQIAAKEKELRDIFENERNEAASYLAAHELYVIVSLDGKPTTLRHVMQRMVSELRSFTRGVFDTDPEMQNIVLIEAYGVGQGA
jgi:hypothetical protein